MSEPSTKEEKRVNLAELPSNTYKKVTLSKDVKNKKQQQERICKFVFIGLILYSGSANEDSTVPSILNHLLTKPEVPPEDFFKADIYTSPKFRLDSCKFRKVLNTDEYSFCTEKDGGPIY